MSPRTEAITLGIRQQGISVQLRVRVDVAALAPSAQDESPVDAALPDPPDLSEAMVPETLRHMLRTLRATQQQLRADLLDAQARSLHAALDRRSVSQGGAA